MVLYLAGHLAFTQLMRYAQVRGHDVPNVIAINFVIAAVASVGACVLEGALAGMTATHVLVGCTAGTLYFVHLIFILASYRIAGIGITMALVGSAAVIPVIASHLIWPLEETMTPYRWGAVALVPLAMVLMRPNQNGHAPLNWRCDTVLFAVFALAGAIAVLHKLGSKTDGDAGQSVYQAVLFTSAAVASTAHALWKRAAPTKRECVLGLVLGLVNSATTRLILLSIAALTAVIFFTTGPSLAIILSLVAAAILWRERITARQGIGVVTAIAVVVLANV